MRIWPLILPLIVLGSALTPLRAGVVAVEDGGFLYSVTYYGWLNTSDVALHRFNLAVVDGTDVTLDEQYSLVRAMMDGGTEVYMYLSEPGRPVGLGSSYRVWVVENSTGSWGLRLSEWRRYVEGLIDRYSGRVDGVFLDECDPSYFTDDLSPSNPEVRGFDESLRAFVEHAHGGGLKVFINGVRAYAGYGDYYLWELWGSEWVDGGYRYVENFFSAASDNPYDWINGYAKWLYLRERGLLNRTIGHSYADPSDLDMVRYDYLLARAMGLAGWSFATKDNYAEGGALPPYPIIPLGSPITGPEINTSGGVVRRVFTGGIVELDVVNGGYRLETPYPFSWRDIAVDGSATEWGGGSGRPDYGLDPGLDIVGYGFAGNWHHSFFYIETRGPEDGRGWWVFIDWDLNPDTGYSDPEVGVVGADYILEIYRSGGGVIGIYNKSSGWFSEAGSIYAAVGGGGRVVEAAVPGRYVRLNGSRVWFATINRGWGFGDVEPEGGLTVSQSRYPLIPIYASESFCEEPEVGIGRMADGMYVVRVTGAKGPEGTIKVFLNWSPGSVKISIGSETLSMAGDCSSLSPGHWCAEAVGDGIYRYTIAFRGAESLSISITQTEAGGATSTGATSPTTSTATPQPTSPPSRTHTSPPTTSTQLHTPTAKRAESTWLGLILAITLLAIALVVALTRRKG